MRNSKKNQRPSRADVRTQVERALKSPKKVLELSDRELEVLQQRFLGKEQRTLDEVARALVPPVTRERARQIEGSALGKLGIERSPGRPQTNPEHPFARWLDGRSKTDVAEALETSVSTLNRLAAGTMLPSLALAARIERYTHGQFKSSGWVVEEAKKEKKAG